ncbi:MAG TPA: NAD-dependent epimerase/dehydratase family protein [Solirubrobacterales bacterium]|nr:NAD-dependent epimerase/dehydratase family protein [Solirubrobacterales bacterium]
MPRTLVVGSGFIGSHVVTTLAGRDEAPRVLTRSRPAEEVAAAVAPGELVLGDAADPALLERALEGIERVAYCAGGLLPTASERDPERDRELTMRPLEALLAALRARPEVALVYLSSGGTVYGDPARLPAREDDPAVPISTYGRIHLACEQEIETARRESGLCSRILRCSTVYGEHQAPDRGQGAVVTFLDRIERGAPIDLYGDGETIRDYIYAGDVAAVVVALLGRTGGAPVLNVGAGVGTSLLDLLRLTEAEVGSEANVVRHPPRGFEVRQIVLDTTALHGLVELEPTPLAAGIHRTHRWLTGARARA